MRGRRISLRASVGERFLDQVDRLFGDDLGTIANELLHSARRAGASRVTVRTDPDDMSVTVSDDGEGIAADRAGSLLTVGGEGEPATAGQAGRLGLAALACRGAIVLSQDWSMTIPPGALVGRADAVLTTGRQRRRGMAVTFHHAPCHTLEGRAAVRAVFGEAAEAMPFDTVVDDGAVRRARPIDLLIDDRGRWVADDTMSTTVGDCVVTVGRFEDGDRADLRRSPRDRELWGTSIVVRADLLGTVARFADADLAELHPILAGEVEDTLETFQATPTGGWWRQSTPRYLVVFEAHGMRTLASRLADRGKVLHGRGVREVGTATAGLVATLAARAPRNAVPERSALRGLADELGLRIPQPQVVGRRPGRRTVNDSPLLARHVQERGPLPQPPVLVIEGGATTHRDQGLRRDGHLVRLPPVGAVFATLLSGATKASPLDRLIEINRELPGMDVAEGADLIVDGEAIPIARDGRFEDDAIGWAWGASGREPGLATAGSIVLRIATRAGRTVSIPLAFAITEVSGSIASHAILVTASASHTAVLEAWTDAFRWHQPAREGWVAQLEAFQDRARELLLATRGTGQGASDDGADGGRPLAREIDPHRRGRAR